MYLCTFKYVKILRSQKHALYAHYTDNEHTSKYFLTGY